MSVPSNPTLDQIVAEGLALGGEGDPKAALTTRAKTIWIQEIKNDIWKRMKKPKLLQVTSHAVLRKGQSRYAYPSDFSSDLTLTLLFGSRTGTATGGASGYIDLAASEDASESELIGREVLVTSGTGAASLSQVTSYDSTTKRATVTPDFPSPPTSGSTYMFIGSEVPIEQRPVNDYENLKRLGIGQPAYFFPMGDENNGEFRLNVPPDENYGARLRYYANIMKIPTTSTLMSVLYLEWQSLWRQGVYAKLLKDKDDDRADAEWQVYQREIGIILGTERYGADISHIQERVGGYL